LATSFDHLLAAPALDAIPFWCCGWHGHAQAGFRPAVSRRASWRHARIAWHADWFV